MTDDFSPAAVVRRLERGQQVVIPSSKRTVFTASAIAVPLGIGLLAFLIYIVTATLGDGASQWVIVVNLRMWAIVAGIIGCLVVAPIGVFVRLRRPEGPRLYAHRRGNPPTHRTRAQSEVARQGWARSLPPSALPGPESRSCPFLTTRPWTPIGPQTLVPYR